MSLSAFAYSLRRPLLIAFLCCWIPLSSSQASVGLLGHNACHIFNERYHAVESDHSEDRMGLNLVASFAGLKPLTKILNEWSHGAEHFNLALHFFFQWELNYLVEILPGLDLTSAYSPTVKFVRLTAASTPEVQDELQALADQASQRASILLAEYLFRDSSPSALLLENYNHKTTNPVGFITFMEMKKKIPYFAPTDLQKLRTQIRSYFQSPERLQEQLRSWYGVGAARKLVDAHFYSRVQTLAKELKRDSVRFNPSDLEFYLEQIQRRSSEVQWLFANQDPDRLLNDFQLIRSNYTLESTAQWDGAFRNVMTRKYAGQVGEVTDFDLAQAYFEVRRYFELLNLIDYLPEERLVNDVSARERFGKITNPTGIGMVDARRLGARNMLLMHQEAPHLLGILQKLKASILELDRLENESGRPNDISQTQAMVKDLIAKFDTKRVHILQSTDAYVQSMRNFVSDTLKGLGVMPENFVLWASGDDIFFVYRQPNLNPLKVAQVLKSSKEYQHAIRVAVATPTGSQNTVSLSQARASVGLLADALKVVEKNHLDFEVFAVMNSTPTDITLYRMDNGGSPQRLDPVILELLRGLLPQWTVN